MPVARPPFHADQVGSLLRPPEVKAARERHAKGELDDAALRAVEDRNIERVIARQEAIGLQAVSDGELRRAFFNFDFVEHFEGVEAHDAPGGFKFGGGTARARVLNVTGKVRFAGHPMLDQFRFLKAHTGRTAKWTIPSPSVFHFRFGRKFVSESAYPDMEALFADAGDAFGDAVRAFGEAGCTYLQIDECPIAFLCDPAQRAVLEARGDDPDEAIATYAAMINRTIAGAPAGMTVALHLCRGNYRSTHAASGSYAPVAELLFNGIDASTYFLEYDTDRAGDFEPLRHVPAGKSVVLGLVTTKTAALEAKDAIRRRVDEASRYVPLDRLALSPQCGFASTEEGNALTEDEQWRKLELVVDVARDIWGAS